MLKNIHTWLIFLLICGGCSVHQGDFGAKFCAAYSNYDSAAFHLQKYVNAETDAPAYYWMFLGFAEMYRGNIPEMHAAFARAEATEIYPEQLLLRCNWYIESGDVEKAGADLAALRQLLARRDFSRNYNYYRFLTVLKKITPSDHDPAWRQVRDHGRYQQMLCRGAELLAQKLERLKNTPGQGLFVLREIADPALTGIVLGMPENDLYQQLGDPYKKISVGGMQKRRILVYNMENSLIGFFFTAKSDRLGEVKTASCCPKHGADKMRLRKRGRTSGGKATGLRCDNDFAYTADHKDPTDFDWICLACQN